MSRVTRVREEYEIQLDPLLEVPLVEPLEQVPGQSLEEQEESLRKIWLKSSSWLRTQLSHS